ncbi:MAG: MFS transporter [Candidatus Promineifilaceae bacterium]|nr:MFS transporter [Candidatus Promineifilaceae bacterium]
MTDITRTYLNHRDYQAVALSHFLIDILNSSRSLLIAILAVFLGLSNVQVGIVLILYNVGNALSQPFFGRLADQIGPRWPIVGGIGWMIIFYSLAALASPWLALVSLTVAGLGSGAFHPTGTMIASQASDQRRTQATSVFFMAGQLGLFVGPILAGVILEEFGRSGYVILPILASAGFFSAWRWISDKKPATSEISENQQGTIGVTRNAVYYRRLIFLGIIILCTSTISLSAINFAPIFFTELGYSAAHVGLLSGIFMLGSAVGGVAGGSLADRWNGKIVIVLSASMAIIPLVLYVNAANLSQILLLLTAGFFVGMPHSVLVLMVQQMLPDKKATASGLALGFMFFSGSLGVLIVGYIADQIGLALALQLTAALAVIAIIATFLMPDNQTKSSPAGAG